MPFATPPPQPSTPVELSFPTPQILLVTLANPAAMNCLTRLGHQELASIWAWYDGEPTLRCAIITGARASQRGLRRADAFCAGADLKEWLALQTPGAGAATGAPARAPAGFMGLSTRAGKKPVVAAVHGLARGGGVEALAGCDLVLAHVSSTFALPEVARGVVPIAGVLPRLALTVGMQRATELALTGRVLAAADAERWGFVNRVVDGDVVAEAVKCAEGIAAMSPDAVIVTRAGLRSAWEGQGVDGGMARVEEGIWKRVQDGENVKEGLRAFQEKREPKWRDSKL